MSVGASGIQMNHPQNGVHYPPTEQKECTILQHKEVLIPALIKAIATQIDTTSTEISRTSLITALERSR